MWQIFLFALAMAVAMVALVAFTVFAATMFNSTFAGLAALVVGSLAAALLLSWLFPRVEWD